MNDTPTPRTDAAELTEPYEIRALGFCVVHIDFARQLERERDDWAEKAIQCAAWIEKAIKFASERESNAMQALAYKAERDEARETIAALERQSARIPRSGMDLAELLARHGVVQSNAIDDWEDYDGGAMMDRIYAAHAELISENA